MNLRTYRVTFLVVLLAAIVLTTSLYLMEKGTVVTVELKASRLSFVLGAVGKQGLFNSVTVRSISLSNIRDVTLGPGRLSVSCQQKPHIHTVSGGRTLGSRTSTL